MFLRLITAFLLLCCVNVNICTANKKHHGKVGFLSLNDDRLVRQLIALCRSDIPEGHAHDVIHICITECVSSGIHLHRHLFHEKVYRILGLNSADLLKLKKCRADGFHVFLTDHDIVLKKLEEDNQKMHFIMRK